MKKYFFYYSLVLAAFLSLNCSSNKTTTTTTTMASTPVSSEVPYTGAILDKYCSNPKRLLVIETKQGTMKIQLFDKIAPGHVAQITKLTKEGKYNGCTFHRCIPGFMIQGVDPNSKDDDLYND